MMLKLQKEQMVQDIKKKIQMSKGIFLFQYHGLSVEDITGLRRKIRQGGGELKIFKNTLVRLALKGTPVEKLLMEELKGPIAYTFSYEDVVSTAKALVEFEKEEKSLELNVAVLNDKKLSFNKIKQLAKLPPREVLLSQLMGTLVAPISALIRVLSAVPRDLIYVLKAIEQKKQNNKEV